MATKLPNRKIILATIISALSASGFDTTTTLTLSSARQQLGRPSYHKLEVNRQSFSEIDSLKAKRLSIRQRHINTDNTFEATATEKIEVVIEKKNANILQQRGTDITLPNDSFIMGLEYLYDEGEERHSDDLFHIILLPSTFQKSHMSVDQAAESCASVLGIQSDKAKDLSLFAKHQGFSCLGTWTRDECISLGGKLRSHELECRVIPFVNVVPESLLSEEVSVAAVDNVMMTY